MWALGSAGGRFFLCFQTRLQPFLQRARVRKRAGQRIDDPQLLSFLDVIFRQLGTHKENGDVLAIRLEPDQPSDRKAASRHIAFNQHRFYVDRPLSDRTETIDPVLDSYDVEAPLLEDLEAFSKVLHVDLVSGNPQLFRLELPVEDARLGCARRSFFVRHSMPHSALQNRQNRSIPVDRFLYLQIPLRQLIG